MRHVMVEGVLVLHTSPGREQEESRVCGRSPRLVLPLGAFFRAGEVGYALSGTVPRVF
jgi:hypothetical protein